MSKKHQWFSSVITAAIVSYVFLKGSLPTSRDRAKAQPTEGVPRTDEQKRNTKSEGSALQSLSDAPNSKTETPDSSKRQQITNQKEEPREDIAWLRRQTKWIGYQVAISSILTAATIGVLVYHAYIFRGQQATMIETLKNAEKNTKLATDAMVYSNRPYLGAGRMEIEAVERGKPMVITVVFNNEGNTPARDILIAEMGAKWGEHLPYKLERVDFDIGELLPHRGATARLTTEAPTEQQFEAFRLKEAQFFIYGRGTYQGLVAHTPSAFADFRCTVSWNSPNAKATKRNSQTIALTHKSRF